MYNRQKILQILNAACSNRNSAGVSAVDLRWAKENGLIFEYPAYESHAEAWNRLQAVLGQIDARDVADAFLYSLSTRKLEYRSALGSYYYAKAVPAHELTEGFSQKLSGVHCYLCGWDAWLADEIHRSLGGWNTFQYERFRYGGVRHTRLNYALFDLEQFLKLPRVTPTDADRQILREILSCVDRLNGNGKVGKLRDAVTKTKIFKTNRDEVSLLLGELGICGILAGEACPSYDRYFANEYERAPQEAKNDFAYPVNRWRAADGVNADRLWEIFEIKLQ